jgi:hypothetical protein
MIPTDGTPSRGALDIFIRDQPENVEIWCEFLTVAEMTPEAIASYVIGVVPETVYNLLLSAIRQLEIDILSAVGAAVEEQETRAKD